ncbi:MAG: hypothetical protein Q8N60_01525, partial [Candidatus Diapherotrites archaeon]|nr:hypothetical protein [Candidatus Diapherotrites archaeon]
LETIEVLDEAAGRSGFKHELEKLCGGSVRVTTTDVRSGNGWPDKVVDVMDLADNKKGFGKNRFHLVVSTVGGALYGPLPEKAIFQIVSVLKPGGIGVVSAKISNERLKQLAKRFNLTIKQHYADSVVFSKNVGREKKR